MFLLSSKEKKHRISLRNWGRITAWCHPWARRRSSERYVHMCTCRDINRADARALQRRTHTAGMPCRHHWHLDGSGTMRAQWKPVAGSLPHWVSQWSDSNTEAGCSLGKKRARGRVMYRVSKREGCASFWVRVCLSVFFFSLWCEERQWQLIASICVAKPNR